jgi:hypothetical protein
MERVSAAHFREEDKSLQKTFVHLGIVPPPSKREPLLSINFYVWKNKEDVELQKIPIV